MKSNPLATRYVAPGKIAWQSSQGAASLAQLRSKFVDQLHCRAAIIGPHGSGKSTLLEQLVPMLGPVQWRGSTVNLDERPGSEQRHAGQLRAGHLCAEPSCAEQLQTDHLRAGHSPTDHSPTHHLPTEHSRTDHSPTERSVVWLQLRGRSASRRLLLETRGRWARRRRLLVIDGYEQLSRSSRCLALLLTQLSGCGLLVTAHRATWLPILCETEVDAVLARMILDQLLPKSALERGRMLDAQRLKTQLERHQGNLRELFMELYDELEP